MEIKQSILDEVIEYAELMRGRSTRIGLIVDLALLLYSHPELQDLSEHHITGIITGIMDDL